MNIITSWKVINSKKHCQKWCIIKDDNFRFDGSHVENEYVLEYLSELQLTHTRTDGMKCSIFIIFKYNTPEMEIVVIISINVQ